MIVHNRKETDTSAASRLSYDEMKALDDYKRRIEESEYRLKRKEAVFRESRPEIRDLKPEIKEFDKYDSYMFLNLTESLYPTTVHTGSADKRNAPSKRLNPIIFNVSASSPLNTHYCDKYNVHEHSVSRLEPYEHKNYQRELKFSGRSYSRSQFDRNQEEKEEYTDNLNYHPEMKQDTLDSRMYEEVPTRIQNQTNQAIQTTTHSFREPVPATHHYKTDTDFFPKENKDNKYYSEKPSPRIKPKNIRQIEEELNNRKEGVHSREISKNKKRDHSFASNKRKVATTEKKTLQSRNPTRSSSKASTAQRKIKAKKPSERRRNEGQLHVPHYNETLTTNATQETQAHDETTTIEVSKDFGIQYKINELKKTLNECMEEGNPTRRKSSSFIARPKPKFSHLEHSYVEHPICKRCQDHHENDNKRTDLSQFLTLFANHIKTCPYLRREIRKTSSNAFQL